MIRSETSADQVWNRAALEGGGVAPAPGDRALASLLLVHGLVMNGGVHHAIECVGPVKLLGAADGYAYFGFDDVAAFFRGVAQDPVLSIWTEETEAPANRRYEEMIPDDSRVLTRFEELYRERPEQFAPLDERRIEIDDVTRPQVLELLEEHLRDMHSLSPSDQVFAFDASKLRAPGIVVWTAWSAETLLGCAALKELSPTQGELKSMRTPANVRRHGAGRALLDHILHVSRERGYLELFLETGRHPAFEPAQTLYRSVGFRECGPFGDYRENGNSVFMSLCLGGDGVR